MAYALILNGQVSSYPYTLQQFRRANPGVEMADLDNAEEFGVVYVNEGTPPQLAEGQTLDEGLPVKVGGDWFRNWLVHDWLTIEPGGLYARVDGGEVTYPYTEWDLRRDFSISARSGAIKQMDGEWGVVPVEATEPPSAAASKLVEQAAPVLADGVWKQAWRTRNRTADELAEARTAKQAEIRERRWQAEIGGMSFNGISVRTDETSQNKIAGGIALFDNDPTLTTIDYEAQPGMWVTLDKDAMKALGVAVGRHIQACFTNSKALIEAAASATWAELASLDINAGWPE